MVQVTSGFYRIQRERPTWIQRRVLADLNRHIPSPMALRMQQAMQRAVDEIDK